MVMCQTLKDAGLDIKHILKTGDLESHEHLEQRLLKLHDLSEMLPSLETPTAIFKSEAQLELFNTDTLDTSTTDKTATGCDLENLIEQAYQLQGEQIAYVEEHRNTDASHERAS